MQSLAGNPAASVTVFSYSIPVAGFQKTLVYGDTVKSRSGGCIYDYDTEVKIIW